MRMDVYFIAPQKNRPSLFGSPLVIPCNAHTKNSELYSSVWQQLSRFVSAPPPGDDLCPNRFVSVFHDSHTSMRRIKNNGLYFALRAILSTFYYFD